MAGTSRGSRFRGMANKGDARIPTPIVLAVASAMVSIGVVAYFAARQANTPPTEHTDKGDVLVDTTTPERVAETFLDAWRKREHTVAAHVSIGRAHDLVIGRQEQDLRMSREEKQLKKQVWDALAKGRLAFHIDRSENLAHGRIQLEGVAVGEFVGKPYRRQMQFVVAPGEHGHWLVADMRFGEILSRTPDVLEIRAGRPRAPPTLRADESCPVSARDDDALRLGTEAHYRDARYYDQTYRRRRHDVRFYADVAEARGGPVLELGVGTGRVALEIARRGVELVGVDRMPEMLARARERLDKQPHAVRERVTLRRGDMRRVRVGRRFPLVISPFNVFMHLYERRDVEQALGTVRRHLRPGGRFVFDVLLPDPRNLARDPLRVYRGRPVKWPSDGRRYHYGEHFQYDPVRQVQLVTMAFQAVEDRDDLFVTPLAHRQFFPAELEALLHYNGFTIEARWGDFEREPLQEGSESQVIVAKLRRR